jgi:aminoglycoside phosphotransferase (APT) family kinase protein
MVYRLRFQPAGDAAAASRTAILKYYPPFLKVAESVPFSQERYFVEKEALLFNHAHDGRGVKVPQLLAFDDATKCIIMEDAGEDLVSLMDYFAADVTTTISSAKDRVSPEDIARKLAAFLTSLYSLDITTLSPCFHNTCAWEMLSRHVVGNFEANLSRLGVLDDLQPWVQQVQPAAPPPDASAVFIMGDLWPNSVYINPDSGTIWLLDWEVARFGSPLSDTRQMLANLYLMEKAPERFRARDVSRFRRELVKLVTDGTGSSFGQQESVDFMVLLACIILNEFWSCSNAAEVVKGASRDCAAYLAATD